MKKDKDTIRQEDLERIKHLRLIDDIFMTICFDNYIEGAELLLKVILDRDDLKVSEVRTQKELKNIGGRSVWLDIYATDRQGNKYNIEVQRSDKGANPKRARYHSAMLDSNMLDPGEDFSALRETINHVDRVIREGNVQFNDGEHIIYVNGSMRTGDSALGRLMSDFYSQEADSMYYKELSDKVRHYKESEEGVKTMCDTWEEIRNEGKIEASIEHATAMLKSGKLSMEEIAEFTGLSIEKVRELAGNKSA